MSDRHISGNKKWIPFSVFITCPVNSPHSSNVMASSGSLTELSSSAGDTYNKQLLKLGMCSLLVFTCKNPLVSIFSTVTLSESWPRNTFFCRKLVICMIWPFRGNFCVTYCKENNSCRMTEYFSAIQKTEGWRVVSNMQDGDYYT